MMIGTLTQLRPDPFRASLHHHQPMAYPHPRDHTLPSTLELDVPASSISRFPTSSVRREAPQNCSAKPPTSPPKLVYPRYDPLHILSQPPTPAHPTYPVTLPAPPVAPGVLADGILTAMLPSVRQFLQSAAVDPPACPHLPDDNRVLALAALSVFYRPLHPAHWVFWNKEQKKATAAVVQTVLDITPTPILSPIGWIAIPEMLWILASMQHAYAPALAPLSWYATYVPAEPENRMNLRKRKAPAILPSAAAEHVGSGDETIDEDERVTPPPMPPRKRAKTRRGVTTATANRLGAPVLSSQGSTETGDREEEEDTKGAVSTRTTVPARLFTPDAIPSVSIPPQISTTTITKEAKRERIASPTLVGPASALDGDDRTGTGTEMYVDVDVDVPELRKSVRQRERKARVAAMSVSDSPVSVVSALALAQDHRQGQGQGQGKTPSRASSSTSLESVGGGESGSSTAVSLYDEEGVKPKSTSGSVSAKSVIAVVGEEDRGEDDDVGAGVDIDEEDQEDQELPVAKKPRTTARSRSGAKNGSRARSAPKNHQTATAADDGRENLKTNETARARPRARARTSKARRR